MGTSKAARVARGPLVLMAFEEVEVVAEVVTGGPPSLGRLHWSATSTSVPLRPTESAAVTLMKSQRRKWFPWTDALACVTQMSVL